MDRNLDSAKLERDVDERVTRNSPELVLLVEHGARNTTIDSIRDVSWNLGESETGIEDGNKLTVWRRRHKRIEGDGISVGTNNAVSVGEYLPMLVGVSQSMDFVNHELGVGGDVRVLGKDLVDGHQSRVGNDGSVGSVEVKGNIRRRDVVPNENAVQDTVS